MLKRVLSLLLAAAAVLSLAACGGNSGGGESSGGSGDGGNSKTYRLVAQSQFEAGSTEQAAFTAACEDIELMSGGRIDIQVNAAGAIVPGTAQFDAVDSGALDFALETSASWNDKWVCAPLFDMGIGGMSAAEHFMWFVSGGGKELAAEMVGDNYNVVITGGALAFSQEIFLTTTKPINSVEDIKGLKIRTAGDDGTIFADLGASLVNIPAGEIYEAMSRGTIDAFQYMSPAGDVSIGLNEVAKYVYLSPVRQPCSMSMVIFNKGKWLELPEDLQQIVVKAFDAKAMEFYGQVAELDAQAIEVYKESGVEVLSPPADLETAMKEMAEKMYDGRAAEDPFYQKILDSKRAFAAKIDEIYGGRV